MKHYPIKPELSGDEAASCRSYIMGVVNSLHEDFQALGLLQEAGPHLHRLMAIIENAPTAETPAFAYDELVRQGSR